MLYFTYSLISDHITIDNCYYLLSLSEAKRYDLNIEINEFKKVRIKNCTCYYFDDIIKLENFDLDNISINKKSREGILIY